MGVPKAEEYWTDIEKLLKAKRGSHEAKKTSHELERQFSAGRSGLEKRGLGK